MTFEQLAGLIKAGYTEEQIRNIGTIMGTGTNTNTNTPTPTPTPGGTLTGAAQSTPTPTPTPADNPTDKPTPTDNPTDPPKAESETVTLLREMLGMMQRGNINTMGTGTIPEQTGADVLAEILNPTPKTK